MAGVAVVVLFTDLVGSTELATGLPVTEAERLRHTHFSLLRNVIATRGGWPLGTMELKGFPEPLPVVEVGWEALAPDEGDNPFPVPARLLVAPPVGFFGRGAELAALATAFKQACAGEGRRVVLLSGDPGMGKTALCTEFVRAAWVEGAVVLYGRCEEEIGIPFQPFAEALGHYVAHAPTDALAAHVATYGADLATLIPALRDRISGLPPSTGSDPEAQRHLLFASVTALLASASTARPVVVVLDDLHWADPSTLLLLRHLVRTDGLSRLTVIGTYRGSEVDRTAALTDTLASLRREPGVERIELDGLADAEVSSLMASGSGHNLGAELSGLAEHLRQETGGNPFFLLELIRHLVESGWLFQEDGRWRARPDLSALGIPESLREVVGQRIGRLGDLPAALLTTAAVIGRDFDVAFVAALAGVAEEDAIDACDRAVGARLLSEVAPGAYSFAHAVVQYTLYESQGPTRRALAHRRVAEMLERLHGEGPGPRAGEIARHWLAGHRPEDTPKAIDYTRWAAEAAVSGLAPEEAVRWYSEALALEPDGRLLTTLLIGLGNAQRLTGDTRFRDTFLEAATLAQRLGHTDLVVQAALENNRGIPAAAYAVDREHIEVLEAALTVTSGDSTERARLLAALAGQLAFARNVDRGLALAEEAIGMARRVGEPATFARVANMLAFVLMGRASVDDRVAVTGESVQQAEQQADLAVRHWAHRLHLYACQESGDLQAIDRHLPAVVENASAAGDPALIWGATFNRSWRALLGGDLAASETLTTEAFAWGERSGSPEAAVAFGLQLVEIRRQQDRLADMETPIADAVAANPRWAGLRPILAGVHCDLGQVDAARDLLRADSASRFAVLGVDWFWLYAIAAYAEVCARLGEAELAPALIDLLAPWNGQVVSSTATTTGAVALYLGMLSTVLGQYDDAEAQFTAALATHRRMEAPYWVGKVQLETARLLLVRGASGDGARAAALLGEVEAVAGRHGFAALIRQSRELR